MRITILITLLYLPFILIAQSGKSKDEKYVIIKTVRQKLNLFGKIKTYNVSIVNQKDIDRLSVPLRAFAAYYSGFAASDCVLDDSAQNIICNLTTALGLKYQGSDTQIAIISKWFPNDKSANEIVKYNCWVGYPGSTVRYNDYSYLKFTVMHDTVVAQYKFGLYSRGKPTRTHKDVALVKGDSIYFLEHDRP
jgi:hypothetical protein